mmetsp:Transcript_4168/g.13358  ORF Transcript_4168/g.13358 Transcript_4168/m.13358 type:complete len:219 (+) Transcript_4168:2063-2719(+)
MRRPPRRHFCDQGSRPYCHNRARHSCRLLLRRCRPANRRLLLYRRLRLHRPKHHHLRHRLHAHQLHRRPLHRHRPLSRLRLHPRRPCHRQTHSHRVHHPIHPLCHPRGPHLKCHRLRRHLRSRQEPRQLSPARLLLRPPSRLFRACHRYRRPHRRRPHRRNCLQALPPHQRRPIPPSPPCFLHPPPRPVYHCLHRHLSLPAPHLRARAGLPRLERRHF